MTFSMISRRGAMLAAFAVGVMLAVATSAWAQDADARVPLAEIGPDDVMFRALDRDWTREEFESATRFFPPPSLRIINQLEVPFDDFLPSQIETGIREMVTNLAAGRDALDRGMQVPDPEELERALNDIAIRIWLRREGVIEASYVKDEDVEEFRERHRERLTHQERLQLRHMFFATYEEVEVEEGDTLESISERVNGDAKKASHILSAATREPRAGKDAHETGQTVPEVPLMAGEVLLVPMGEDRAAEVEALAIEGWRRVTDGEDFVTVARELTGNPNAASLITVEPAKDEKPMLEPLRAAFDSIGDGEFSEPVRTRHGFQVVYRESHEPERLWTLAEVRGRHLMDLRQDKAADAYVASVSRLWEDSEVAEVDEEVLASIGEEDADWEAVIAEVNGQVYRVRHFMEHHGERLDELDSVEARRGAVIEFFGPLQEAVMLSDIGELGIRDSREYELAAELVEATMLTPVVIDVLIEERLTDPTEEDLRARFAADADRLTQVPSAYVWQITVTADTTAQPGTEEYRDAARAKLQELSRTLAEIEDVEHFERIARELSEDEFAMMGGRVGRVNSYQEDGAYKQVIERMRGRGPVGPLVNGRNLQGYWVEEVFDTSETAFQDVREILRYNEISERRLRIGRRAERDYLEGAGLEILFTTDVGAVDDGGDSE